LERLEKLKHIPSILTKYNIEANTISLKNFAEPHIRWVRGLKRPGCEVEYSMKREADHPPEPEADHSHPFSVETSTSLSHNLA
jgi:hypothetical protein